MNNETTSQPKKTYETPKLVAFGSIEALTGMQQHQGLREDIAGIPIDGRPFSS